MKSMSTMRQLRPLSVLVSACLYGIAGSAFAAPVTYDYVGGVAPGAIMPVTPDTGFSETSEGRRFHEFAAMNDYGTVVGQVVPAVSGAIKANAAKWKNKVLTNLGTVGCEATVTDCKARATGVNNFDMVVGASNTLKYSGSHWSPAPLAPYHEHQVQWVGSDSAVHRGNGVEFGWLRDVSNDSVAVGSGRSVAYSPGYAGDYLTHGFISIQGETKEIGIYGQKTVANAINELKTVTGGATVNGKWQAFTLSYGGTLTSLADLGGGWSEGIDINESGWIAGDSAISGGAIRAFLHKNGVMSTLAPISGDSTSRARAINDAGLVVGYSTGPSGKRAVVWENGVVYNLNSYVSSVAGKNLPAGTVIEDAVDVNKFGDVLVIVNTGGVKSYSTLYSAAAVRDSQPVYSPGLVKAGYQYQFGGSAYYDQVHAVRADSSGNSYVAGYFTSRSLDFDPTSGLDVRDSGDPAYSSPTAKQPAFLTKLNSDGTYGWTKTFVTSKALYGYSKPDYGIRLVGGICG